VLHQEGRFGARLSRRIDSLVANTKLIIAVNSNLGFFTTGYNYLIQIIPVLIVAPLFIRGKVEFGVISQSAMAFSQLLGAFSLIVTQFQQISSYAVVLARLSALRDGIVELEASGASGIEFRDGGPHIGWERLSLRSPDGATLLLASLTCSVAPGRRLLATGPNEAARLALFRATAGLWRTGEGYIERPSASSIMFVTERPHLPPGTLRDALLEMQPEGKVADADVEAVLGALGIADVVARAGGLDVERDWDDVLSLAEQQRISFARVLLAVPSFAVLDRPATLLGADVAGILRLLAERSITTVTFAPDDALAAQHEDRLLLELDASWSVQPIRQQQSRTA
jgi:putative ATP-binding cassette transporter